jgi:hypothetical protein
VLRVSLDSDDRLEAVVNGIALGDHVSLFLAERRHADPWSVDAIERLKAAFPAGRGPATA